MIEVRFVVKVDDRYRDAYVWLDGEGDNARLRHVTGRFVREERQRYTNAADAAAAAVRLAQAAAARADDE